MIELERSEKRLKKIKNYNNKLKGNGFQFLLQSLDRGKQNLIQNTFNDSCAQIAQSLYIAPISTNHSNQCDKINQHQKMKKQNRLFIQNVKMLDRSDASIEISKSNRSRNEEKQSKQLSRTQKNFTVCFEKDENSQTHELLDKLKKYLTLTQDLVHNSAKAKKVSKELILLVDRLEISLKNQKKVSEKRMERKSYESSDRNNQYQSYTKIINELEVQKSKLNSLISKHEMANIKMYIQMNEGESYQIEMCKRQLSLLFQKYKKLQALINSDKKKLIIALKQKQEIQIQYSNVKNQLQSVNLKLEKCEQQLKKQKQLNSTFRRQENVNSNRNNEQSYDKSHEKQQSGFLKDVFIASSTTTARPKNHNKSKVGINLTAFFQGNKDNKIIEHPQKFKKLIKECQNTNESLQQVINEQNKELEFSVNLIQQFKNKFNEKERIVKCLESKLALMEREKQQKDKLAKTKKTNEENSNSKHKKNQSKIDHYDKSDHKVISRSEKDIKNDEYYIIMTQALKLQQILKKPRMH